MATLYTEAEKDHIRTRADQGATWEEIGRELGDLFGSLRSSTAVAFAARRMRDAGEWPDNPLSVRKRPAGPGRPRNRKRSIEASIRFAPDVAAALRDVAEAAGYDSRRTGAVLNEAARRAVARAQRKRVNGTPFALDPGTPVDLVGGNRSTTLSLCIDADVYAAFVAAFPDAPPTTALHDAAVKLLQDLNYRIAEA